MLKMIADLETVNARRYVRCDVSIIRLPTSTRQTPTKVIVTQIETLFRLTSLIYEKNETQIDRLP